MSQGRTRGGCADSVKALAMIIPEKKHLNNDYFYMQACKPPLKGLMAPKPTISAAGLALQPEASSASSMYLNK